MTQNYNSDDYDGKFFLGFFLESFEGHFMILIKVIVLVRVILGREWLEMRITVELCSFGSLGIV